MVLTRAERWILSKQYEILQHLDPDNAEDYGYARTVIENGYELHYDQLCGIKESPETMSEAECNKVHDIADMFSALKRGYEQLDDDANTEITEDDVAFMGFADYREIKYMEYARYYYAVAGRGFPGLDHSDDFGDCETYTNLDIYERMLAAWHKSDDPRNPTGEDLRRIVAAREATEEPCP